jgi:prevent-host-death family protein
MKTPSGPKSQPDIAHHRHKSGAASTPNPKNSSRPQPNPRNEGTLFGVKPRSADVVVRFARYTDHMARKVTATAAKAGMLRLLDDAAAGEEIEITKHGRPVARLVPASGARSLKGSFTGVAMTAVEEQQLFSTGAPWNAS